MIYRIAIFGPLASAMKGGRPRPPIAPLVGDTRPPVVTRNQIEIDLPSDSCTCTTLRQALTKQFHAHPNILDHLGSARFAVNHEFVSDDHSISSTDEIALICAVSGG